MIYKRTKMGKYDNLNYMIIVGLGNPGEKYKNTRHNIGWIILDNIFPTANWSLNRYAQAFIADEVLQKDVHVILVKPQTFMNESGISVSWIHKKFITQDIFVLYDDLDLPVGSWKLSYDRGNGGHNGIKSIEQHLQTKEFFRVRIGISKKLLNGKLIKPNVLGNFETEDQEQITTLGKEILTMLEIYARDGKDKAMTFANSKKTLM